MKRRDFVKGMLAGVASVAISMKMATAMPDLPQPSFAPVPEDVKFTATERFIRSDVDWRALYGTPVS